MGYETTLLIGSIGHFSENKNGNPTKYFQLAATLDLCKIGNSKIRDLPWVNETPEEMTYFWYAPTGDGDTQNYEDRYGDIPQPLPIANVIDALEQDVENDDYRRLKWALALLTAMEHTGTFHVLLWGH